ncbi:MAG: cell division protein FtsQ/DivIB [Actinomycetota bacterium]
MRRMSDIVITPDDRPGVVNRPRRELGDTRKASEPKPKAAKRKAPRLRLQFTTLQKLAAGGVAMTALVVSGLVAWHAGAPQRLVREAGQGVLGLTATAGFRLGEVTISGRVRTPAEEIMGALGMRRGDPILALDIAEAKDRLEEIPSVRVAAVERRLPGTVHLEVVEREPVAVWQHDGRFTLVDRDGHQIPGGIEGFEDLLLVVGDGAPGRADELLTMLTAEPKLIARVKAAVRVGNRRWNIKLDDAEKGIEVRLPETDPEAAWHRLAELEGDRGLSGRQITMIDLRVPDRLVLKSEREQQTAEGGAARPAASRAQ